MTFYLSYLERAKRKLLIINITMTIILKEPFNLKYMGSWGYYPKDNDGALDLFDKINNLVNKHFDEIAIEHISERRSGKYYYAGGVMILLQKGFYLERNVVEKARDFVQEALVEVKEGKSTWVDVKQAEIEITEVLRGFNKLLKDNETDNIMSSVDWLCRELYVFV